MQSRELDEPTLPAEVLERILHLNNFDNLAGTNQTCMTFHHFNSRHGNTSLIKEMKACLNHDFNDPNAIYPSLNIYNALSLLPTLITQISNNTNPDSNGAKLQYFIFLYLVIYHIIYTLKQSNINYKVQESYEEEFIDHFFCQIEIKVTFQNINQEKLLELNRHYSDYFVTLNERSDLESIYLMNLFTQLEKDIKKLDASRYYNTPSSSCFSCFGLFGEQKKETKATRLKKQLNKVILLLNEEFKKFNDQLVVNSPLPFY